MSNNPAKYEVLIKQYSRSILSISDCSIQQTNHCVPRCQWRRTRYSFRVSINSPRVIYTPGWREELSVFVPRPLDSLLSCMCECNFIAFQKACGLSAWRLGPVFHCSSLAQLSFDDMASCISNCKTKERRKHMMS